MSLFSSIKKVLGFPDEYDDDDEDLRDLQSPADEPDQRPSAVGKRIEIKPIRHSASEDNASTDDTAKSSVSETLMVSSEESDTAPSIESELPGEIFDAVIDLFNRTQPEFVAKCLDIDTQRAYMMDNISTAVRTRMIEIAENARLRGEQQWKTTRARMDEELRQLMADYNSMKQQREEFQNEQLSSKRQRRALGERIRDLEAKVSEQNAEIEQYQLENHSMASRLRAMTVRAGIQSDDPAQKLSEENVALQDKITNFEKQLEEAHSQISQLTKQLEEATDPDYLSAQQQAAIDEIEERMKQFEEIKAKKDNKIAALTEENRRISGQIEELAASRNNSTKEVEQLMAEIDRLKKEADGLKAIVEDSEANRKDSDELKDELKSLSADNDALKSQLSRLSMEKQKLGAEIEKLNAENKHLRETSPVQPTDSEEVNELRNEVRRLTDLINSAEIEPTYRSKRGRKKKRHAETSARYENSQPQAETESTLPLMEATRPAPAKISAIDELMDSTDWFTAPDPVPIKKDPEVEEEFGYKEPVRKPTLDSDKQLSLF